MNTHVQFPHQFSLYIAARLIFDKHGRASQFIVLTLPGPWPFTAGVFSISPYATEKQWRAMIRARTLDPEVTVTVISGLSWTQGQSSLGVWGDGDDSFTLDYCPLGNKQIKDVRGCALQGYPLTSTEMPRLRGH